MLTVNSLHIEILDRCSDSNVTHVSVSLHEFTDTIKYLANSH